MKNILSTILLMLVFVGSIFSQTKYEQELAKHVSNEGLVDYKAWKAEHAGLEKFLEHVRTEDPNKLSIEEQKAYYINVYNATAIKLILDNYPIKSINDINQPFDSKIVDIAGKEKMSLNELENNLIRKRYNDPRIHFAVNCAAISCPKLSNKMYKAPELDKQLEASTQYFLTQSGKNVLKDKNWQVSKIFDWYSVDFDSKGGALAFIAKYIDTEKPKKLNFLEYNWALNKQ